MAFNFGALAGGAAEGIKSGVDLWDQVQARKLREAQLNAFNANNLGQQAWTNAQIPGMTPVPQGVNTGGGLQPILSQMPIIGPIGRELGIWGPTPAVAQPPMLAPQGGAPTAGMPPSQPAPAPQTSAAPAPAQQPPSGIPTVGQNAAPTIQDVAMAVDRANPGLRQSNPAAFAAAVKMGLEYVNASADRALDTRFKNAQIEDIGSQRDLRKAQAENIPVQTDLTRAQIRNQEAEISLKGEELKQKPAELAIKQAQIRLEEAKQEAAQQKMRLDEAELRVKEGDYNSQREWRDAQIASLRAERMLKMQKQKVDELKSTAEVQELGTRSKKNEAEAGYLERKGLTDADQDKLINQELTKSQVQLRFHENQINDLLTSMNPNDPKIKARINDHARSAAAYRERVNTLEGQLSTAKKPAASTVDNSFQNTEIAPQRQTELGRLSQEILKLSQTNDTAGAARLVEVMKRKGMPAHEIQWVLDNARTLSNSGPASAGPQVPQSR